jgi:hypothetical protein
MGTCELCTDCGQGKVARSYGRRWRIRTGGFCPPCRQLAADVRDRPVAGAQLLYNDRVHAAGAAQVAPIGGQVDSRPLANLAALAALCPLDITGFCGSESGVSAGVTLHSAEVAAATPLGQRHPGSLASLPIILRAQAAALLARVPGNGAHNALADRAQDRIPGPLPVRATGTRS